MPSGNCRPIRVKTLGMTDPQRKMTRGWRLWPTGYWAEYRLEAGFNKLQLSELCDRCVREFVPSEDTVLNIKGRDTNDQLLASDLGAAQLDQLFTLKGNFYSSDENEIDHSRKSVKLPFSYTITSRFLDFPNNKDIRYGLESTRDGALPNTLTLQELGQAIAIEPLLFRLALSFFKPKLFFLLGINPAVIQTVIIEADQNRFALLIAAECMREKTQDLSRLNTTFSKLAEFISGLVEIDILTDLAAREI